MESADNNLRAQGQCKRQGRGQWPTGKTGPATPNRDVTTNRGKKERRNHKNQGMGRGRTGTDHCVQSTMEKMLSFRLGREDSVISSSKARLWELS